MPSRYVALSKTFIARKKHRKQSRLIAYPGLHHFDGGIYNPGSIVTEDGCIIMLAKGQACHWWDAVGDKSSLYYQGMPVIFNFRNDFVLKYSAPVSEISGYPAAELAGLEDFRLFQHKGTILVNHSVVQLARRHPSVVTFQSARPALSRLDINIPKMSLEGFPLLDFPLNKIEKNWIYASYQEELYLFYSFMPYKVLKLNNREKLEFKTVVNVNLPINMLDLNGFDTMLSYSTNPIDYSEHHWLVLIHQVDHLYSQKFYNHWAILIDKTTRIPTHITSRAILYGRGARGRMPGILYVSSIIKFNDDFVCLAGEGDAYVTSFVLNRKVIDSALIVIGKQ